jgi:hypothetical protein
VAVQSLATYFDFFNDLSSVNAFIDTTLLPLRAEAI